MHDDYDVDDMPAYVHGSADPAFDCPYDELPREAGYQVLFVFLQKPGSPEFPASPEDDVYQFPFLFLLQYPSY